MTAERGISVGSRAAEGGYSLAGLLRLLAAVSTAKTGTTDGIEKKRKKSETVPKGVDNARADVTRRRRIGKRRWTKFMKN